MTEYPSEDPRSRYHSLESKIGDETKEQEGRSSSRITMHDRKDASQAIQIMTRNYKATITRNRLKLVAILNLVPLIAIISTMYNSEWYQIRDDNFYDYWINFLIIGLMSKGPIKEVRSYFIFTYRMDNCYDNRQLCEIIYPYFFAGTVSAMLVAFGILLQIFNMVQLSCMIRGKGRRLKKYLSSGRAQLLIFFMYLTALCYWFGATGLIAEIGQFNDFISRLRYPILVYAIAVLFYLLLMTYHKFVFTKGRKNAMVNKLLYQERELLREYESGEVA